MSEHWTSSALSVAWSPCGRDDGWAVRGESNQRDTSHHRTQSEAERAARDIAINQRSGVLIHGENGRIREHNSYGNDPHPPKG